LTIFRKEIVKISDTKTTITIRIDMEVYDELKKHIEDFTDTPNAVLRRMLNLPIQRKPPVSLKSEPSPIYGRSEAEKQREKLRKLYGGKIDNFPMLYHAGWPLGAREVKKYFFGITKNMFEKQVESKGIIIFICKDTDLVFLIPAKWILEHVKQPLPENLKLNIFPSKNDKYFWQNKRDGILLNNFKNKLPELK
jgi:hypothetical protein